jgi:flagellar basal body-associated protein FliL
MYIPLMILGILFAVGVVGLIVWQIRSRKAEARRWIERK